MAALAMAVWLLFAMATVESKGVGMMPTCKEQKLIVDAHNDYRRDEGASDMKKMVWRSVLAEVARNYSTRCIWEHGDLERPDLWYFYVGQNLYTSTNKALNFADVVESWFIEKKDYTFDTKYCVPGKMCGHYTQVVWANSSDIGCGYTECATLEVPGKEALKNYLYVVCSYGPTGNYDQLPLYKKGSSCSQCPSGYEKCDDKLCSSDEGYGDIDLSDPSCTSISASPLSSPLSMATDILLLLILIQSINQQIFI